MTVEKLTEDKALNDMLSDATVRYLEKNFYPIIELHPDCESKEVAQAYFKRLSDNAIRVFFIEKEPTSHYNQPRLITLRSVFQELLVADAKKVYEDLKKDSNSVFNKLTTGTNEQRDEEARKLLKQVWGDQADTIIEAGLFSIMQRGMISFMQDFKNRNVGQF